MFTLNLIFLFILWKLWYKKYIRNIYFYIYLGIILVKFCIYINLIYLK